MKVAILKNDFDDNHEFWIRSCIKHGFSYDLVDMLRSDWLACSLAQDYNVYLTCPPGREALFKQMYDERIYILDRSLGRFVYPNYNEISIHENKRFLSYWLKANKLPHAETWVFYNQDEAELFIENCRLPIVGKINIGASGKGVSVFRDRKRLSLYLKKVFSTGIRQQWGPNIRMGGYWSRLLNVIRNPLIIRKKLIIYSKNFREFQKGFVILQKYVPHSYEWRVVRIGDSYFGHQKIKHGDKASGTKGIEYVAPPVKLLDFVRIICDRFGFSCMAIDLFEDGKGGYLINEMQCIFGHVQEYICEQDGKPGRYKFDNGKWSFEEGLFNTNLSYDLRFENVIQILRMH